MCALQIKFAVPKQPAKFMKSNTNGPKPLDWVYADPVTYAAILVDDKACCIGTRCLVETIVG